MSFVTDVSSRYVLLFLAVISYALPLLRLGNTIQESQEWSYLVLAQRWPESACKDFPAGQCVIPKYVNSWTIHGLWPTSKNGYPSFCNSSWPFHEKDIDPILGALEVKWPNILKSGRQSSFWDHEWIKHGTCATSTSSMDSILKYFSRSIELYDKFNFYQILRNIAVTPGKTVYVLPWIEAGIKLKFNKTIKLFCKSHKGYEFPLLDTVYFCFDKRFDPIDCNIQTEASCNSARVIYPPMPNNFFKSPML